MDLETQRALYVTKGKDGASLKGFWKEIKKQRVKLKAEAIDMYIPGHTDPPFRDTDPLSKKVFRDTNPFSGIPTP